MESNREVIVRALTYTAFLAVIVGALIATINVVTKQWATAQSAPHKTGAAAPDYVVPSSDEFDSFVYVASGHQCVDFVGYFGQYAKVTVNTVPDYDGTMHSMTVQRPDGAVATVYQAAHGEGDQLAGFDRPIATIIITATDAVHEWRAEAPKEADGLMVDDPELGIILTEARLSALVDWVKASPDESEPDCPFAGYSIPHSGTEFTVEDGTPVPYPGVLHYD